MKQNNQDENQADGMSLNEVAAALGITAGRVRQIELRALGKLRRSLLDRGLVASDFAVDRGTHSLAKNCM